MARTIAVGIGIMEYPFDTTDGFWRWVDLCEQGGIDSIWQTDRMISRSPILECMTALAAIAGRPHDAGVIDALKPSAIDRILAKCTTECAACGDRIAVLKRNRVLRQEH